MQLQEILGVSRQCIYELLKKKEFSWVIVGGKYRISKKSFEILSPEQEEVLTKYCDEIFASGAETEEFFYRLGIKDGLRLKSTVKSVLEMMS